MSSHQYFRLANLLTFTRLLLTVPFFFFFRAKMMLPSALCFGLAAITDLLDGKIARKEGITEFGSFMDSIVDKILVATALISFCLFQHEHLADNTRLIPIWMVVVILGREFIVTTLRIYVVAKKGDVISANKWGKYKALTQMTIITISLVLLIFFDDTELVLQQYVIQQYGPIFFMMLLPVVLTVASGIEFLYGNRKIFSVKT